MIEVELLRGEWKKLPNNPTKSDGSLHEYCPPEQVASEMDQLIAWHQEHLAKGIPPEVEAAWLHHRFTQIHPFQDGNGRMARTLASLIFLRAGLFPLVIHRDERDEYIDVLEKSDKKNLKVLIKFFAQTQKKAINQAINSAENVLLEDAPLEQIIQAGISTLKRRKLRILDEENNIDSNSILNSDYAIPSELLSLTDNKLREVAIQLRLQLQEVNPAIRVGVVSYSDEDCNQPDFEEYFEGLTSLPTLSRIVQAIAKNAGYSPNFRSFCAWSFLQIATGTDFEVILSFHAVSKSINNLIAVIAFLAPEVSLGKEWEFNETPAKPLNKEVFQITTEESEESIITRFNIWLDEAILNGLNYWQRQL